MCKLHSYTIHWCIWGMFGPLIQGNTSGIRKLYWGEDVKVCSQWSWSWDLQNDLFFSEMFQCKLHDWWENMSLWLFIKGLNLTTFFLNSANVHVYFLSSSSCPHSIIYWVTQLLPQILTKRTVCWSSILRNAWLDIPGAAIFSSSKEKRTSVAYTVEWWEVAGQ